MLVIKQERKRQRIPHVTLGPSDLRSGFHRGRSAHGHGETGPSRGDLSPGIWTPARRLGVALHLGATFLTPGSGKGPRSMSPGVFHSRWSPGASGEGLALLRTCCPPPQSSFPMALQPLALHTPAENLPRAPPLLPRGGERRAVGALGGCVHFRPAVAQWESHLGPSAEVRPPASQPAGLWQELEMTRSQGILSPCCGSVC